MSQVIWDGLFSKLEPLDVEGLLACHRDVLTRPQSRRSKS